MTKYGFELLQVGESTTLYGTPSTIRSSASMWGRRYGIWLTTTTAPDGAIVVKRVAIPIRKFTHRKQTLEEKIKQLEDGQRFIAIMVTKIHKLLENSQ